MIDLTTDTSRGRPFAKDPNVVKFGGRYLMYYSIPPHGDGRGSDGWAIGIAESGNARRWSRVGELSAVQPCERNGFCAPGAIVLNGRVELYYQTYGNGERDAICRAWSDDGIHFERDSTNPIFSPTGDWNNGRAIDADVAVKGDHLYLLCATRDPSGEVQMLCAARSLLSSSLARNTWEQISTSPALRPELAWEQKCIEAPAVLVRDDRFHMFYAGAYNCCPQQIGYAVSDDAARWRRVTDQPFLANGAAGEWNSSESGHPGVFEDGDGRVYLFYQGSNDMGRTWFISSVELSWSDDLFSLPR
jgi:predicted GH43/DUF377 family glycosyl hydrolase